MIGNAEDMMLIAVRKGFDEAVANTATGRSSYLKINDSSIDSIVERYTERGTLFATSRKRILFTNVQSLDIDSMERAVTRARDVVGQMQSNKDYRGIAEGPFRYRKGQGHDRKILNYDNRMLADMAQACIDSALENGADKVSGAVYMSAAATGLATSNDVDVSDKQTVVRISLRLFKGSFSTQSIIAARFMRDIRPERFARETAELLGRIRDAGRIESGSYDIVYTPSAGGALMAEVPGMAAMGDVESGTCFTKKMGKKVASGDVSIYDDGNMKGAVDASPYDDEGYPTQRTPIIKDGRLVHYLHNASTARKYKTRSTGNAGLVNPMPNTMCFEHRKKVNGIDDLIRKVDRGILVTNTGYTRFANVYTGEFSTVPKDLTIYIEHGEPKFAIQQKDVASMVGIRISENVIRMLKGAECAARDTRQETSWEFEGNYYFMPSLLVRDVAVTAA